ncbi:DUF998 domain-containing protein [Actinoplanes philippinensis]|uniref:DUF998 domain-containing protein n=1 Tax=Actinoplanes philippinensis TaxID=35752 RepID=UPI0033E73673
MPMIDRRAGAVLAALGAYLACTVTADLVNPGWSPVERMVSHYVHGRAGWLIPVALLSLATGSALLSVLLAPVAPRRTVLLLRVWTVAVLAGAVFPADAYGRWDQPPSVSGLLHGLAALTAFTVLPAAALSMTTRPVSRPAAVTAALTVVTLLLLVAAFVDVQNGPSLTVAGRDSLIGLAERVMLWTYVAWLAVTATTTRPAHAHARRS